MRRGLLLVVVYRGEVRPREVKQFTQSHRVSRQQSVIWPKAVWVLNPYYVLPIVLYLGLEPDPCLGRWKLSLERTSEPCWVCKEAMTGMDFQSRPVRHVYCHVDFTCDWLCPGVGQSGAYSTQAFKSRAGQWFNIHGSKWGGSSPA